jgi:hypothetical protein
MRVTIAAATKAVAEIAVRFKNGDSADDAIRRLNVLVPVLVRYTTVGDLPDEVRAELAQLFDRIRDAVATGDEWLVQTEPELIALQVQKRLRRVYGMR